MKPKPAILLLFLVLGSTVFLAFLIKTGDNGTKCCREKAEPVNKMNEIPSASLNHLIAFARK